MSKVVKFIRKSRFAFELAVLLPLALYVTVQAGGLGRTTAAPASISLASATSTVPGLLNYQGYLTDNSGAPLDGSYAIKFAIYDAPTDGNELWSETQLGVEVNDGQLSALLGESVPISSTFFATYPDTFIGVTVGSDPEMTPRQRIHSVPYTMYAEHARYEVAAGTIIHYYPPMGNGNPCPSGYVLADGNNGTPDLSGLFLRASDSGLPVGTTDPFPKHTHQVVGRTGNENETDKVQDGSNETVAGNNHHHNFNVTSYSNGQVSLPPYYVVNFCIKQ